ncbi:MAG: rhodanese-like domain-containing protein [Desulfobacterales bacterium]|jgi:rhodanese-related sulfurtransferase
MTTPSKVFETAPLDRSETLRLLGRKLGLETDPSDVHSDLQNGSAAFVLVDVRSPEAYAKSHAVGAINIPHPDITETTMAAYPADTLFVVYCWGPGCNGADKAAYKLSNLGRPVKIMIGGIEYWEDRERYPVARG